jgi:hypothetical protein
VEEIHMAGPTRSPDTGEDTSVAPDRASTTRTPLWVWVVGIVVLGTSLAMLVSMTVPLLMGGMSGGGH